MNKNEFKKKAIWLGTLLAGSIASVFISDMAGSDWLFIPLAAAFGFWHGLNIEKIYKYFGVESDE